MSDKIKIMIDKKEKELKIKRKGNYEILEFPIVIKVAEKSFLHIGAASSPLTEKKGTVFKVDRIPVIPATSFKGALRHQLELLFIKQEEDFLKLFNISQYDNNRNILKPCIPSPRPTKAEQELINNKKYRSKQCNIHIKEDSIQFDKNNGICPVCYFMGNAGLMGFLRFRNFYPEYEENSILEQTNIRIDRKAGIAAQGAKVEGEQVKPETIFKGAIDIVISEPILEMQNKKFGDARVINNLELDKWLKNWKETDKNKRRKILIENILVPAIQNITFLGGQKSRGAGRVNIEL